MIPQVPGTNPRDMEVRGKERAADNARMTQDEMRRNAMVRETGHRSLIARLFDRVLRR